MQVSNNKPDHGPGKNTSYAVKIRITGAALDRVLFTSVYAARCLNEWKEGQVHFTGVRQRVARKRITTLATTTKE
jgi:hypothetical protein